MSVSPDPVEASAPLDPAAYRARPLMGPLFWALIGVTLVCVIAGVVVWAVWSVAPRLRAEGAAGREAPVAPRPYEPPARLAAIPPPAMAEAAPGDLSGISERLAALEAQQARTASAAASALAAAALVEASQNSQPFPRELAALESLTPANAELTSLRRLAETGAPSRAALIASFPDYAARAAGASRAPSEGAGLGARIAYALSRVVTLRQVGDVTGSGVDATLARAEQFTADGDLDQALRTLDALPAGGREALAPWRARAERRAEIDRRVEALRDQALQELARIARPGPGAAR